VREVYAARHHTPSRHCTRCRSLQLPFFRKYRLWKNFTEWRKGVRSSRIAACRTALQSTLFALNPVLRTALNTLHSMCLGMVQHSLFRVKSGVTYTVEVGGCAGPCWG
jgi:hypothetical protein